MSAGLSTDGGLKAVRVDIGGVHDVFERSSSFD